jgi:hypothetical protein
MGGGMWALGCVEHMFNTNEKYTSPDMRVPMHSKYSVAYALSVWM